MLNAIFMITAMGALEHDEVVQAVLSNDEKIRDSKITESIALAKAEPTLPEKNST